MEYKVEVRSIIRPDRELDSHEKADILARIAAILREFNGGGGGLIVKMEVKELKATREGR